MSSSRILDNDRFAQRMVERRAKARFPDLPEDVRPCDRCQGAGSNAGTQCTKCEGFGFHRANGLIARVHSAMGGFYRWGAVDAMVETMINIRSAYAGPCLPDEDGVYLRNDNAFVCSAGENVAKLILEAESARFGKRALDRGLIELWLMPTPAPISARLTLKVSGYPDLFEVGHMNKVANSRMYLPMRLSDPAFTYDAVLHHTAMCSDNSLQQRLECVLKGDYTSAAKPLTVMLQLLPEFADHEPIHKAYQVTSEMNVGEMKADLGRAFGAAQVQIALPEAAWLNQPSVYIVTL